MVDGPAQLTVVEAGRVATGGHRIEAQGDRALGQREELDLLVAGQAGIGRLPRSVGGHELVDDVVLEPVGEVPDIERDPEYVRGTTRIGGVLP